MQPKTDLSKETGYAGAYQQHIYWIILLLLHFYYFIAPYEIGYDTTHSVNTQVLLETWSNSVYKQGWLSSFSVVPGLSVEFDYTSTPLHYNKVTFLLSLIFLFPLTLIFYHPSASPLPYCLPLAKVHGRSLVVKQKSLPVAFRPKISAEIWQKDFLIRNALSVFLQKEAVSAERSSFCINSLFL